MPSANAVPSARPLPAKTGLFKRIATRLRSQSTPPPVASSSTAPCPPVNDASEKQPIGKPKRKGTLHLPPVPRIKAPTPSYPNEFLSVQHREAALRSRGLVPRRYRDANGDTLPMSEQEAEMDRRFSTFVIDDAPGSSDDSHGSSEAKRIREDWVKRNVHNGVGSSSSDSLGDKTSSSRSSMESHPGVIDEEVELVIGRPVSPRRPKIVERRGPPLLSPSQAELRDGMSENGHADEAHTVHALDPADVPLPASPLSTRSGKTGTVASAWTSGAAVFSTSELGEIRQGLGTAKGSLRYETGQSTEANRCPDATGREDTSATPESPPVSPLQAKNAQLSPLPALPPPAPSSPPPEFKDPRSPRSTLPILTVTSPPIPVARGRSAGAESSSSNMPALSPTRTTSSTSTSDAPHTPQPQDDSAPRLRSSSITSGSSSGSSRVRSSKGDRTRLNTGATLSSTVAAVIVESPTEEDGHGDLVPDLPTPRFPKSRGSQDSARRVGFFNKRSASANSAPEPVKTARPSASLSNLRRSVTGTLTTKLSLRPKSALVVDTSMPRHRTTGATSHSALSSSNLAPPLSAPASQTLAIPRARQPLSPTMHSRGSILLQAKEIEDEESRRLSELAFLDF